MDIPGFSAAPRTAAKLLLVAFAAAALVATPFVTAGVAFAAQADGSQWLTVDGQDNQRYSSLSQINSQNVTKLGAAWVSDAVLPEPSARATGVVDHGLFIFTAPPSVYAVNIASGKTAWQFQAPRGSEPARGGVAIGDGLVYVGLSDSHLVALNEDTGELVWKVSLNNPSGQSVGQPSGAPLFADGIVSIGLNADNGFRGQIVAVDAKTGHPAWRFFVIPAPGQPGSDTWPKNSDSWQHGGGAVWLDGVYDPSLGVDFYGTGNAVPQYGGENRPGDNLFTDSVVALDAKTGKLRWYYQVVHHDIWEADIAEAPVLFDADVDGHSVKAIGAMRTDGYLFTFNRVTGKPLEKIENRAVPQDASQKTAATQPYPVGAQPVLPDCDYWKTQTLPQGFKLGCFFTPASFEVPNLLAPVYGMRSTPMAYDPQTRYFYATGDAALQWFWRAKDPDYFSGSFTGRVPGLSKFRYGVLAAIDSRTDTIAWQKKFHASRPSGALATAGGLVFQSTSDGNLQAYDAKTGSLLWQFQTGAVMGGPPVAFEENGDEYIATIADGRVWAFKLGGTLPQKPAPPIPPDMEFSGTISNTSTINTASLARDSGISGPHFMTDEYQFDPYRAQVTVGAAVTFRNNGTLVHTIEALDGSWSVGPLHPLDIGTVTFDKPGTYEYHCKEYPWEYGEIIVVPAPSENDVQGH
jgi:quinohemoprotein ethanol dehydrogenase